MQCSSGSISEILTQ